MLGNSGDTHNRARQALTLPQESCCFCCGCFGPFFGFLPGDPSLSFLFLCRGGPPRAHLGGRRLGLAESRFPAVGRRLPFWQFPCPSPLVPPCRSYSSVFCILHSALRTLHSALLTPVPAILYGHGCPQVSGSLFPVPCSPLLGVIHNGVCPSVHVTNHQIWVKIDQKGDVFRQKGIKKARISSCPS